MDEVVLEEGPVRVTRTQVVTLDGTYALSQVQRVQRVGARLVWVPLGLGAAGLASAAGAGGAGLLTLAAVPGTRLAPLVSLAGLTALLGVVALALFVAAAGFAWGVPVDHEVRLGMAGRDPVVYRSRDRESAVRVQRAIEQAMAGR